VRLGVVAAAAGLAAGAPTRCLGSFCGQLRWWVNGKRQRGDPAAHQLFPAHQEIAIALGRPPARVLSSYTFPPGY
jgi:hypothetical protein